MIYIAGKITDPNPIVQANNLWNFIEAEKMLEQKGLSCFNPARLEQEGHSYEYYLAFELRWILQNRPTMYMLKGWEQSQGARLEHEMAKQIGLKIEYES